MKFKFKKGDYIFHKTRYSILYIYAISSNSGQYLIKDDPDQPFYIGRLIKNVDNDYILNTKLYDKLFKSLD